jgi:hypothetical protein
LVATENNHTGFGEASISRSFAGVIKFSSSMLAFLEQK